MCETARRERRSPCLSAQYLSVQRVWRFSNLKRHTVSQQAKPFVVARPAANSSGANSSTASPRADAFGSFNARTPTVVPVQRATPTTSQTMESFKVHTVVPKPLLVPGPTASLATEEAFGGFEEVAAMSKTAARDDAFLFADAPHDRDASDDTARARVVVVVEEELPGPDLDLNVTLEERASKTNDMTLDAASPVEPTLDLDFASQVEPAAALLSQSQPAQTFAPRSALDAMLFAAASGEGLAKSAHVTRAAPNAARSAGVMNTGVMNTNAFVDTSSHKASVDSQYSVY